jgi:hypothetical protein
MSMNNYTPTRRLAAPVDVRRSRQAASAELRLRIQIGEMQSILSELTEHANDLLTADGGIDLAAYRARIKDLSSVHDGLSESVERLTGLLHAGGDALVLSIGLAVCQTLTRILEAAEAHVAAVDDGA